MQAVVLDQTGKQINTIDLPAEIFEATINTGLMHQAFVRQMANARLGTHNTLTRGEVRMTTAKWYRQKGTGRARHGAKSAPIFVGGGQAFGPRPRKYTKHMPKKMRRAAIRSALTVLARDGQLVFVQGLSLDAPKTKDMRRIINALTGGNDVKTLVLYGEKNENVQLSVHNLDNAQLLHAGYLNIRDLLQHDKVIVPMDALDVIKRIWGLEK
ncbi:MAG: 50S ribosomal protein L4 [Burkholderiales bacterium]|nr:50S ribosomal protein L4 [Anaerolineae bacterium]